MRPISNRTAAIAGGLIVIAGVAIAIVLFSGGSDSTSSAPQAQVQPITSPLAPPDTTAGRPAQAGDQKAKAATTTTTTTTAAPPPPTAGVTCQPEWTPEQCRKVNQLVKDAQAGSHRVAPKECPLPTKQLCVEAAKSYKQGKKDSHRVGENECPLPTKELCEAAGRQAKQSGTNPFD